ncbi:hypothetical protein C2705_004883 [Escherichia coli]|nr:hypothetical protein [Escherichia coli]EFA9169164.1 hypothetical protein [Escherichia coli]
MNIYERIDGSKYRNIWVVGDLHGCYTNLMNKLDTIGFDNKKDLLISVGDLVDRGAENVECLELITFPWFRAVRGNHEQMMIDGLSERGNVNHWLLNGGGWFFNLDYDKEILAKALAHKADELPLIIELVSKGKKYVICHADYPCDEYEFGKPVDHQQVIWNRERISNSQDGIVKEIKGADTFIFGHTPAVKPLKFANQMYIDTGAVFCGNLTLIQVQGKTMRLESVAKFHSPKSPMMSDSPRATASDSLSGTDVMAAMGMAQSQAGFGMAAFCGKHELSQNDKQKAINYLMQFAHKVSGKYRGVAKLEGNTKAKVLQVLATFAYADYCRSAATPGARCRDCHGTGRAVDISKTELWGRVVEKECGRCKGVGYSRMPASAAYRAVTMLIPNLTQPTWSRTVKPLYDALVVQCHKEESIADNILNAVTR